MMLRYSFGELEAATAIEAAVEKAVTGGTRTGDIAFGLDPVNTVEMAAAVLKNMGTSNIERPTLNSE
ncbi:MAG: 3-isopropylmalate dehydrogenase [Lentimonas sp.]|jgi:3-isopropylmalate dehydrogenase